MEIDRIQEGNDRQRPEPDKGSRSPDVAIEGEAGLETPYQQRKQKDHKESQCWSEKEIVGRHQIGAQGEVEKCFHGEVRSEKVSHADQIGGMRSLSQLPGEEIEQHQGKHNRHELIEQQCLQVEGCAGMRFHDQPGNDQSDHPGGEIGCRAEDEGAQEDLFLQHPVVSEEQKGCSKRGED